jgi:hypothetical protein
MTTADGVSLLAGRFLGLQGAKDPRDHPLK